MRGNPVLKKPVLLEIRRRGQEILIDQIRGRLRG